VLACSFPNYFKLAKIAMVQVVGSVKDEWWFNFLAFCKSKLHNRFITDQGLVVITLSQKFYTLHNFLYVKAYEQWCVKHPQYGVGTYI
jgi:hypothetical protein